MLRGKDSQEKWSFIGSLDWLSLNVGHNNVMHGLVLVCWEERESAGDFSLFKALQALGGFKFNVVSIHFP